MKDIGASVLAQLKQQAKTSGISYQHSLQLFFQEEFLRRLSKSNYVDNLVLKGGLFIYTLTNFTSRATVDMDFLLRQLPNSIECVKDVIMEIIGIDTGNTYMEMIVGTFEEISLQRKYRGFSTQITGKIKNVRVPFSIDIGVGDIIVPKAEKRKINTQLSNFEVPEISTYSLESTISEKFDAIIQRDSLNPKFPNFENEEYVTL